MKRCRFLVVVLVVLVTVSAFAACTSRMVVQPQREPGG